MEKRHSYLVYLGFTNTIKYATAGKALWSEHVKTFKWSKENFISEDANTLTVEEYRDGQHSDKQTEPQAKSRSPVG